MTLRKTYAAFLDAPTKNALADNATLHYVSTLTSLNDAAAIIKHFTVQEKLLKKKSQKILDVVEGSHALSVDVETTLEFINGGGAYLPGLDDNFVADRTATFPMVRRTARQLRQCRLTRTRCILCTLTMQARSLRSASTGIKVRSQTDETNM